MKNTCTKPNGAGSRVGGRDGQGEGACWGENGDNYTWTTIKKIKKKKENKTKLKKISYLLSTRNPHQYFKYKDKDKKKTPEFSGIQ